MKLYDVVFVESRDDRLTMVLQGVVFRSAYAL